MEEQREPWQVTEDRSITVKTAKFGTRFQGENFTPDDNIRRYVGICHVRSAKCSRLVVFKVGKPAYVCGSAGCRSQWQGRDATRGECSSGRWSISAHSRRICRHLLCLVNAAEHAQEREDAENVAGRPRHSLAASAQPGSGPTVEGGGAAASGTAPLLLCAEKASPCVKSF